MISVITVHYHVKKELFVSLASIYASKPKSLFEIIVVDNDEKKTIEKELKKRFPKVRYIPNQNNGYTGGNNVGVRHAKGDYLFFLNPDTRMLNNAIDELKNFLIKNKKAAIVAPLLFDKKNEPYELQGIKELTPLKAIFTFSFISKLFPRNKIYQDYYIRDWDKKKIREVDVIPGTAFMIRRNIFEKVGGFDEKFFLFFDEFDTCKRVKQLGWKIFMNPFAHIYHAWGSSTNKSEKNISNIFKQSRFYYFKKHFGLLKALGVELILRINKYATILFLLTFLALYLRLFNINNTMTFIGDQGWFYLSARDMLLTGDIPLVGIASSHPWLHQGALWTYLLAPVLWLFHFHPVSGAYLSAVIGALCVLGIYKLGSTMFSKNVGLIAAALFTTSPLIVFLDRMPYHTSPIPLFTILFIYCLYKWVAGQKYYFPFVIMLLGILYNLEIATFLLTLVTLVVLLYGLQRRSSWAIQVLKPKILLLSGLAFVISMLPMLIYDLGHGFPQTLKFLAWIGYRILVFFGFPPLQHVEPVSFITLGTFLIDQYKQLVYPINGLGALIVFISSSIYFLPKLKKREKNFTLLAILNVIVIAGFLFAKTPSHAYLPVMFPGVILVIALLFDGLIGNKVKVIKLIGVVGVVSVVLINSYFTYQKSSVDDFFPQRLEAARKIVKDAEKKEYTIEGTGPGSQFESFTMNYEYLVWWLGHGPSKTTQELQFVISEENSQVQVKKERMNIKK